MERGRSRERPFFCSPGVSNLHWARRSPIPPFPSIMRTRLVVAALALTFAAPLQAQTQASFMGEMHRDLNGVQKKFIDLANAIPESAYGWSPKGARTIAEVLLHVASENYYLPISMGTPAPASSGITAEYSTTGTF